MNRILRALCGLLALALSACPALADQGAMVGVGGTNAAFSGALTTYYVPIGSVGGPNTLTEAEAQTIWRGAGWFRSVYSDPASNLRTTDTTVCLRVAGVDVSCQTWGSTASDARFDPGAYPVSDGDAVVLKVTTGSGTGNFVLSPVTWEFRAPGQVFTHYSAWSNGLAAGIGQQYSFAGVLSPTGAATAALALEDFTLSNLVVAVSANGAGTVNFYAYRTSANTLQTVSFGSGVTGVAEDTTHPDSLTAGDTYAVNKPNPGFSTTIVRAGFKYQGAVAGRVAIMGGGTANNLNAGNTYYGSVFGSAFLGTTGNELATQAVVPFAVEVSKASIYIQSYGGTATVTVDVMKNGVSARAFTCTTAGHCTDPNTAPIAFAAGDKIGWRISGHDGTLTVVWSGMLMTDVSPAAANNNNQMSLLLGVG